MTNEEKAQEICEKNKRFKVECSSLECYTSAMEMAEWKDEQIKEMLLAYTKWLDKRGFFKEDLQCDFPHQIETFLEMKEGDK